MAARRGKGPSKRPPEAQILGRFARRVEALTGHRLMRDGGGLNLSWSIQFTETAGVNFSRTGPDPDDLRGLLTHLRPVVSKGEEIDLRSVWNILHRRLLSDEGRQAVADLRAAFDREMTSGHVGLNIGDDRVEPQELLDLYVNGVVFHDDPVKAARLAWIRRSVPVLSDYNLESAVLAGVHAALGTAHVVRWADENRHLPWRVE